MVDTALSAKLIAAWVAAVVIVAALSVSMNASLFTTALVVAVGLSPAISATDSLGEWTSCSRTGSRPRAHDIRRRPSRRLRRDSSSLC